MRKTAKLILTTNDDNNDILKVFEFSRDVIDLSKCGVICLLDKC